MYKQIKKLLEKSGIELSDGLKESEIDKIEQIYEFKFPKSLKDFLSYTLPISVEFYNWRDFSDENIKEIKQAMNYVFEYLKNDPIDEIFPNESYWNTQKWDPMPEDQSRKRAIILEAAKIAPKIIPYILIGICRVLNYRIHRSYLYTIPTSSIMGKIYMTTF